MWSKLGVGALFLALAGIATSSAAPLEVAGRRVPPPAGASEELRELIAQTPEREPEPVPQSIAEWETLITEVNGQWAEQGRTYWQQAGVTVTADVVSDVPVYRLTTEDGASATDHLFVYLHGGAYLFGAGEAGLFEAAVIAQRTGVPVLSVDYRMPPADPFPAALDDVVAVYSQLIETLDPVSIMLGGTSAGGGLALASVQRFLELGLPVPGAVYAGTPWADLTKTSDTLYTNQGVDRILSTYDGSLVAEARLYADGVDLADPSLSPVYGDFSGFPPTILVSGTRDMLLSDTVRVHRKQRDAGVDSQLHVYEGLSHAEYFIFPETPESRSVYSEMARFMSRHLKKTSSPAAGAD